ANELFEYIIYYNNFRPHQALGGKTPKEFADALTLTIRSANK
ncbi:MAG: integrase core domain-containing protein, partial [Bradyrhizobium sp.]|nr:integrase core domain-containing protein [Bradyrhizobium sp.]